MLYSYVRVICPLLVALGCARVTSPELPKPDFDTANTPVPATPVAGSPEFWTLTSDIEPHTYTSVSNIMLELAVDSGINHDSMVVMMRYSLALDRINKSTPISGSVDLFSVEAGSKIRPMPRLDIPVFFTGKIINSQITIDPVDQLKGASMSLSCPNSWSTIVSGVRRNIFLVPSQISRRMTWLDSTSSTACHGSTPISLTLSYTYRVIGEINYQGIPAILIQRIGKSSSIGQGSEGQHRVTVNGEGSTAGNFYIDKITGLLLAAEDKQNIRLIITLSGRNQEFTQTVHERITLTGR